MTNDPQTELQRLRICVANTTTVKAVGRVAEARGTVLRVTGLAVRIGEVCRIVDPHSDWQLDAEVIGLAADGALLTPLGQLRGLTSHARVDALGRSARIAVGDNMLGRVLDAAGLPLDGGGHVDTDAGAELYAQAPAPLERAPIDRVLASGVRAIDSLLCCGEGQRLGVFAPAGAGKSTLLGMLARGVDADVNVVALIGERGREVCEFVERNLTDCLHRTVVIAATSDAPPLVKTRAMYAATAVAEHFRDRGARVLLLVDSMTRFARALRDVGLAAGELPVRHGFPPSVFSALPQLLERAGTSRRGAITAFYTMLVEDDDHADPVAEEVRSILDGHIVLSRRLSETGHFPAIDVLRSASRLMERLVDVEHARLAALARRHLAKYDDIELLVQMGEYERGRDADADACLDARAALECHLRQSADEVTTFDDSYASLRAAVAAR